MRAAPKKEIAIAAALFAAYVLLDAIFCLPYLSTSNPLRFFDFSAFLYSAIEVAAGRPLLSRDWTYYGLPTHAYHALFVKVFGGHAAVSLRIGIACASGAFAAVAFLILRRVLPLAGAGLLTLALWPALSGFAYGYGMGYGAIYVFLAAHFGLWLVLRAAERAPRSLRLFVGLGALAGTAYAFKFELGLVVIATLVQSILLLSAGELKRGVPLRLLGPALAALATLAALAAIQVGVFGYCLLPIALFWAAAPAWGRPLRLPVAGFGRRFFAFSAGAALALSPWVAWLALEAGPRFALTQYFPFFGIGEQMSAMQSHGSFFLSPSETLEVSLAGAARGSLRTAVFPFIAFLLLLSTLLLPRKSAKTPPLSVILLALFSASAFAVCLREAFCEVYFSYGLVLAPLAWAIHAYRHQPAARIQGLAAACLLVFVYSGLGAIDTLRNHTLFAKPNAKIENLGLHAETYVPRHVDGLANFFRRELAPDQTIFAFTGIRLPYVLAERPASDRIRMPYFLFHSPEVEDRLLEYLEGKKTQIQFVVSIPFNDVAFSGAQLERAFSKVREWRDANYQPYLQYGPFIIHKRK